MRRRRILGQKFAPDEGLQVEMLERAGVGPVANAQTLHDAVMGMRKSPIGKAALMAVLVPIVLPMLVVFAIQIPIKTTLFKVLKMVA